eukprot:SAG31_NODE_4538_length_3155_cov_5.869437_3_plen_161_part_00
MHELRTSGKLSIADRAKIRLLVGDREHLVRVLAPSRSRMKESTGYHQGEQAMPGHRQLQDQGSDALSADTLAIVFSVLVGTCGYLLQAWTSDRAQRHAGYLQREHDEKARELQVAQETTQAQVRRAERWVNDFCEPFGLALGEYSTSRVRFGEFRALTVS